MAGEGKDLERRKERDAVEDTAGFSRRVLEIKEIYNGEKEEEVYEPVVEWIALILEAEEQISRVEDISLTMGGYSSHLPLDQYLFLREHFGEDSWKRGSQSIIKVLCSLLPLGDLEKTERDFPNLKYSEPNPLDEDRLEDFIERVESFV